jgi:hypothetical protein
VVRTWKNRKQSPSLYALSALSTSRFFALFERSLKDILFND